MKPEHYPEEPAELWEHFYQISRIPRPSKAEEAVRRYVIDCAETAGCAWQADDAGNTVIRVPGSAGREHDDAVIIQNHLDMVTVKTEDKDHDFHRDALQLEVEDGWLQADRTTLGADNGIGCAAALALMSDPTLEHPPLELLFTVDEETGMGGALNLDAGLLSGGRMLNLDTEDWNELYIGCAGGGGWQFRRRYAAAAAPADSESWTLRLRGLAGGHSGVQIHEQLGNAVKLLAQVLGEVDQVRIAAIDAGVAHNVIPREATALFSCPAGAGAVLRERLESLQREWLGYLPPADHGLTLELAPAEPRAALQPDDSAALLGLIAAFPHGAQSYSLEQPADLVDLSINLAIVRLEGGDLFLQSSFRFFNEDQSRPLQQGVLGLAQAFGLEVAPESGYPGWQPEFDSPLLADGIALHEELFGLRPAVKAIHAGLECGILKSRKPDVDILSFGPTIRGAHSPSERVRIDTVAPFWRFLTALLARI